MRISIGGLAIDLVAEPTWLAARLAPLGAFTQAGDAAEPSVRLDFHARAETPTPPAGSDFVFTRDDLIFATNPARSRMWAVTDGTGGSFRAVLELALQTALLARGGLLVHAAAGVLDGEAWLLPGPSGTGKTTAARGAGFDRVLTDERVVVRRGDAGFVAWGTPFWSEGRDRPFDAGWAPLGVLGCLHQAHVPAATPARPDRAAVHLLGSVALYETSEAARTAAFTLACELVEQVRCLDLDFPREGPWIRKLSPSRPS